MENREGKERYNALAKGALDGIYHAFNKRSRQIIGSDRNATLPSPAEKPIAANLQLVTWLIIKSKNNV